MHPFVKIILAETPEAKAEAVRQLREEQKSAPTAAEVITGFLRDCTDNAGAPILRADEHAALVHGVTDIIESH